MNYFIRDCHRGKVNTSIKNVIQLFFFVGCMLFLIKAAKADTINSRISLNVKNANITDVFRNIEQQSKLSFLFSSSEINTDQQITLSCKDMLITEVLKNLFKDTDINYSIDKNHIVLFRVGSKTGSTSPTQQTNITVKGKVTDNYGEVLPFVNVVIKGTTVGVYSNEAGEYSISVPSSGNPSLSFSFVGYNEIQEIVGNRTVINVTMTEETNKLDEVVVVGYGTQKKINLTGAVEQITGDVFDNRPIPNVTQALQGTVPNLNISMTDGKPNRTAEYNVRGLTSIGQKGSALVLIDGVEGDPSMLNPNDIASVSVLKDAASASIYGARGAFGVVLIQTKNPSKDKINITYTGNFAIKKPTVVPDMVTDGYTFAKYFNEAWSAWNDYSQTPQNINKTVKFSQEYLQELKRRSEQPGLPEVEIDASGNYVYYASTDWYKELYKEQTYANDHNLSISGSSGKVGYYLTGRFYGQDGLFRYNSDDYTMYNLRGKGYIDVFNWLKVDNNIEYSTSNYRNPLNVGEGGSIWRNIADEGHPVVPMFNPDGTLTHSAAYTVGDFWYGKNRIESEQRVFRNTAGFTANFFNNKLIIKGDLTFQSSDKDAKRIRVPVPYSNRPGVIAKVGTSTNDIQVVNGNTNYLATNIYASYENTYAQKHYFKGMIGHNYEQSRFKETTTRRNGLIFEDAEDLNMALGEDFEIKGGYQKWKIAGGFFRLNYIFDNRYLFEVNGRLDASSKFPSNERTAFFPSVSAGWRVSQEHFWITNKIITDLKLRASYGSLGNGNIKPYAFQELFNLAKSDRILGGIRPQYTTNPNVIPLGLTWETATTTNLGADLAFFSNRLNLTGDYYIRKTTDMFTVGMSLPEVFGADVPKGNFADMTTKGFELSIAWKDGFKIAQKEFNYEIKLMLADHTSVIDRYNNPEKKLSDYYEGQKVGEIWGYETSIFQSNEEISNHPKQSLFKASTTGKWLPGDIKFANLDGDNEITYGNNTVDNPGDQRIIGNSEPRYTYAINLSAEWNGFFVSAFFRGVGKQDWWPGSEAGLFWGQYNRPYNDMPKYHLGNIWTEENTDAYFPRYRGYVAMTSGGELVQKQTRYLQNVAYFRLQNLQLGYSIPQSFVSKLKIQAARVYLSGENLWSWSPLYKRTKSLDVESIYGSDMDLTSGTSGNGWNYPRLRTFSLGLSVTF